MLEVNLLPWRETRRVQQKKKTLIYFLLSLLIIGLIVLITNYYLNGLVDQRIRRIEYLKEEIQVFKIQIKKFLHLIKPKKILVA